MKGFEEAQEGQDHGLLKAIVDKACEGGENIRFGAAGINTVVSNEFDPVVVDNRLDRRSARIRDAVIELARAELIDLSTALDSLAVTRDRRTHRDVTSTVMTSRNINDETRSRADIDRFAASRDLSDPRMRRGSFDLGHSGRPRSDLSRRALPDWHYETRPGTVLASPDLSEATTDPVGFPTQSSNPADLAGSRLRKAGGMFPVTEA